MKRIPAIITLLIIIALLVAAFFGIKHFATQPKSEYLQGQVEARRVMVAGKIPGRIASLAFKEGDSVTKGQVMAIISSAEIEAKKIQAQGALNAAKAQANKAQNGARSEQIAAAKAMSERAAEGAKIAQTTYERVQKLYDDGVLPIQKRDEAEAQMKAAKSQAEAAGAQYAEALAGARNEDKAAANALVMQAKGAEAEVNAYLDETKILAPISGEVTLKISEEGEVVGAGSPVMAITDLTDEWAVFNLREDMLKDVTKGKIFDMYVPALDATVAMEVYYIASAGDYAVWKSSKESGGFDLKTFEVRLRPKFPVAGLRPGMTVLWKKDLNLKK
ncbi:MAG: efflux RND transporter periplasmic adaptor subunit [Fibrobacteraceae bacterium]|nr:efflux RND transporter periplasmic adaptor subunit [Fibrobacteraceae bacterium]